MQMRLFLDTKTRMFFTNLIFADPGTKINKSVLSWRAAETWDAARYRAISGDFFIFSAGQCTNWSIGPVRRSRYCSERLRLALLPICDLPTAPTSTLLTTRCGGTMQDRVYWAKVRDVDDLKQRLIDVWDDLEQSVIDDTIDQWRSRLRASVHVKGGHFEQSL